MSGALKGMLVYAPLLLKLLRREHLLRWLCLQNPVYVEEVVPTFVMCARQTFATAVESIVDTIAVSVLYV